MIARRRLWVSWAMASPVRAFYADERYPVRIMSLVGVAKETLEIVERGSYTTPSGKTARVREAVDAAIHGTVLYRPDELAVLTSPPRPPGAPPPRIEVTPE